MVGIIYKLETEYGFYIGYTTRPIEKRIAEHIRRKNVQKFCSSAIILKDAINISYQILETVNTSDKYELKSREYEYIISNPGCINQQRPYTYNIRHLSPWKRVICPHCQMELTKKSLWKHNKRKHSEL
jgi:hypothetical protein